MFALSLFSDCVSFSTAAFVKVRSSGCASASAHVAIDLQKGIAILGRRLELCVHAFGPIEPERVRRQQPGPYRPWNVPEGCNLRRCRGGSGADARRASSVWMSICECFVLPSIAESSGTVGAASGPICSMAVQAEYAVSGLLSASFRNGTALAPPSTRNSKACTVIA